jgi:hypothetical protein
MPISRRGWVLVVLTVAAVAAALDGRLVLALPLAGLKSVLIGAELMELRLAHRLHLAVYAGWALALAAGLTFWLA